MTTPVLDDGVEDSSSTAGPSAAAKAGVAIGIVVGVVVVVALAMTGLRRSRRVAKAGVSLSFDNSAFDIDPESGV
jgi:hypothetical protein